MAMIRNYVNSGHSKIPTLALLWILSGLDYNGQGNGRHSKAGRRGMQGQTEMRSREHEISMLHPQKDICLRVK